MVAYINEVADKKADILFCFWMFTYVRNLFLTHDVTLTFCYHISIVASFKPHIPFDALSDTSMCFAGLSLWELLWGFPSWSWQLCFSILTSHQTQM